MITRTYRITCPSCKGIGWIPNPATLTTEASITCPACEGDKTIIVTEVDSQYDTVIRAIEEDKGQVIGEGDAILAIKAKVILKKGTEACYRWEQSLLDWVESSIPELYPQDVVVDSFRFLPTDSELIDVEISKSKGGK